MLLIYHIPTNGIVLSNNDRFFLKILFICVFLVLTFYFLLSWVFVVVRSFSLVLVSRGYSLVVVCRHLIAVVFLLQSPGSRTCGLRLSRHKGSGVAIPGLSSTDSITVAHRLSCSVACGIFPDQR